MRKYEYVVRKYSEGCYDSAVFNTVKATKAWITGSPFAGADVVTISTDRKCDEGYC